MRYITKIERVLIELKKKKELLRNEMFDAAYLVDIITVADRGGQQSGVQLAMDEIEKAFKRSLMPKEQEVQECDATKMPNEQNDDQQIIFQNKTL